MKKYLTAVAAAAAIVFAPVLACAQQATSAAAEAIAPTVQVTATSVDFTQLLNNCVALIATLIVGVAAELFRRWNGMQFDDRAKTTVENAIKYGLALGISRVVPGGKPVIDFKNEVVAQAASYVNTHAADELGRLKIDPAAVADKIEARLAHSELTS